MASLTSSVAWVQISMSSWRRSSSVMMPLRYWLLDLLRALLVLVQDLLLVRGRGDVLDADRHAGPGGVVEPEVLQVVERLLDRARGRSGARVWSTNRAMSLFSTGWLRYSKSSGNASLKSTRPMVVR